MNVTTGLYFLKFLFTRMEGVVRPDEEVARRLLGGVQLRGVSHPHGSWESLEDTKRWHGYKNVEIRGNTGKQIIMWTYDLSVERLTLHRRSMVIPSTEEDICFIIVF